MTFSTLSLSYCTNVHPGKTLQEVLSGLTTYTGPLRQSVGHPIAAGLWLPASVTASLQANPDDVQHLKAALTEMDLSCYTLNTFPFGDFHSERVKENVYIPDWTTFERLEYTMESAVVLSELLDSDVEGSLSTVPLGFKELASAENFEARCIDKLLMLVLFLNELRAESGKTIRLAIEPEPCCCLETTVETIAFFEKLFQQAKRQNFEEEAREFLGVCYDVCHQAVEFEDVGQSIVDLDQAGIRINKVHITCAIDIEHPWDNVEARELLKLFVEPRYLHQTFAQTSEGQIINVMDLTEKLCTDPPEAFRTADRWRVHYHVPVNRSEVGALGTTRDDLKTALQAVGELDYAPHLEVETYTWSVLPGEDAPDLVTGLTGEMNATTALINELK